MKWQDMEREKIFVNHIPNKETVSDLSLKKIKKSKNFKVGKNTRRPFMEEDIQMPGNHMKICDLTYFSQ